LSHHHFNSYIIHVLAIEDNIAIAKEKKQLLFPLSYSFIFQKKFIISEKRKIQEQTSSSQLPFFSFLFKIWIVKKKRQLKKKDFFFKLKKEI
jgi:hypothetical protein